MGAKWHILRIILIVTSPFWVLPFLVYEMGAGIVDPLIRELRLNAALKRNKYGPKDGR